MLAWMAYATLAGALLCGAGAVLEHTSPWLASRRRLLWLAVIAASLSLTAIAVVSPASRGTTTVVQDGRSAPITVQRKFPELPVVERPTSAVPPRAALPDPIERDTNASAGVDVLLLALWLAGTTLCLGVLLVSAWRVTLMRRTWRESVLAGVPVLVSHDVGPAVIGLVHHGIVVPAWVESLDADAQRTVMTHEREHVRAGDPLLLWGATLLVALTPWNAALWYALRRLRHAIEIDCDVRVLRSRPDTHAYCSLLLDVGERTLAGVAPVAALAEPSTLLERRIEAMTRPARVRRGAAMRSAAAALVLFAAACFAPRPEVAPAARVSALVTELSALLSRDSVRQSMSMADRSRLAGALSAAADSVSPRGDLALNPLRIREDSLGAPSGARSAFEGGTSVIQLARDSFPEAFRPRDGALAVLTVYDDKYRVLENYVQAFRLDELFDVVPGVKDSIVGMRDGSYIISRVIPGWRPRLRMSGTQMQAPSSHTVFAWAVLMPGEVPPRAQTLDDRARALAQHKAEGGLIESTVADSVARSLYPATYATHDGLPVVGLIFSKDGRLLQHGRRQASHDEVFVPARAPGATNGEWVRGGEELLSFVFAGMPARAGRWSTIAHRTYPAPALVWTILPADTPLPTPRDDRRAPVTADRTDSPAHHEARVTLSGGGVAERWVRIFSSGANVVEAGVVRGTVRDTMRLRLPATVTVDLGPGNGVTFESEDGRTFQLSALIAGMDIPRTGSGCRIVIGGSGAGLKASR